MGYYTSFEGSFSITPEPTAKLLRAFPDSEYYEWHISSNDELQPPSEGKYHYTDEALIASLSKLEAMGFRANGEVTWQGEDGEDHGKYVVKNNKLTIYDCVRTYTVRKAKK
jgi:hypothetical protein